MWRERILGWTEQVSFAQSASKAAIRDCEEALGQALPGDLAELLRESDGVQDEYGVGLVWPVQRIKEENLAFRRNPDFATLYMPFEPLLFFADDPNCDQFAYVMRDRPPDVFKWDHETDSRTMIAPNLIGYLAWRLNAQGE